MEKRQVWCPNCNYYRVSSGDKCLVCGKVYVRKKRDTLKEGNKVKFIYVK